MLFESIWFFTYGSHGGWPDYMEFEISMTYFVGFALYAILLRGIPEVSFASRCFDGVITSHQLILISISIFKIMAGSLNDKVWYGFRCILIVICAVPAVASTTAWVSHVLGGINSNPLVV